MTSNAMDVLLKLSLFYGLIVGRSWTFPHKREQDVQTSIAVVGPSIENKSSYNLVCFYDLTTIEHGLQPEAIDPHLCTHIITGYANVIDNTLQDTQQHIDAYSGVMKLKLVNPDLKILLMAGGKPTSEMVRTRENRAKFIDQAISYLETNGFDGFDLDWEFPAWGGNPSEDRENLVQFLMEFRQSIDTHGKLTGRSPLILSLDVASALTIIYKSYDVPGIAKYVDFVNIMCYDYHFYLWYLPFTGINSPLFKRAYEFFLFATMNTAWSANFWSRLGMPKNKINVGIPTYGYTYHLIFSELHGPYAPASGPGIHSGGLTYSTACKFLADGATEVYDEESQVPYAYKDHDWMSYDNPRSVTAKAKWITANQFAGIMVFELNHDDWKGECGDKNGVFPLVRAMKNVTAPA